MMTYVNILKKCRFLHGVFPEKDRPNLAPKLAMMCEGTAWSQVRNLDPSKLLDGANGVNYLLEAPLNLGGNQ